MRAIIADDEPELRHELERLLHRLWPELEIVAKAETGDQALDYALRLNPDIAFLDIKMPGLNGLEVATKLGGVSRVVFITAYDSYAVDAFEQNAIDYLLKPIKEERLLRTITKIKSQTGKLDSDLLNDVIDSIRASFLETKPKYLKWVKVLKGDTVHMINIDDIVYFEADNKYTSVHVVDNEYIIRTPLAKLEEVLDGSQFWRVHRSVIVNADFVKTAKRTKDGRYTLHLKQMDVKLDVSRAYAHLFKHL